MAAVGVDNDASVVPECANGELPVRLSTLASKAHVDMLRSTTGTCDGCPTLRDPPRRATQRSAAQPALDRGIGAADLRLLIRLLNAAGEPATSNG
jgi:hypothetical protein